MGRQRAPAETRWRRLLRAGCRQLLSLCGMALRGLRGLWSLAWVLLMCYKSCWDGAFQVTEELGTALQLRLEGREEEENVDSDSAWESGQTGQWQQHGEAMLGRLEALEADVRFLCTELGAEKLLWSSRFLELLREQQSLHQRVSARGVPAPRAPSDTPDPHTLSQLQELLWRWNSGDSPELLGEAENQSASGSEGESPEGRQWMEAPQQPRGSIQPDRQKIPVQQSCSHSPGAGRSWRQVRTSHWPWVCPRTHHSPPCPGLPLG
ncbi:uncharacterized protein LOC128819000 isoform X1 [Vidua macroura]|uniref:uncharacterized protein LOC128819000 isoform X1 n=1 Tax=Vidua macroura TaxID=187451 RepID=UPI0023A8E623|nr:uncharacterized protein LOC128819000 isoform X1 [Vidua macroura]